MTAPARLCLLVVDDEPDVCESLAEVFRDDYRVLTAENGADACRLMQENEVHLIITDQRMPQMTGVEFLTRVRGSYPQAVRMLFTGYLDLESLVAAINQGHVFRFLRKPCDIEELIAATEEAAKEYRRLVQYIDENTTLRGEVESLRRRVDALENEVATLRRP